MTASPRHFCIFVKNVSAEKPLKNGFAVPPLAGSGTTGVAALRAKHRFIGMALSLVYSHVAKQRLSDRVCGLIRDVYL